LPASRHALPPILVLALMLAGCNDEWMHRRERFQQANLTPPVSYRTDVTAFMRTYLNDPVGVRDAYIAEPTLRSLENADRYTVCVRYTARNSSGQYSSSKDILVVFRDGRLDRVIDNGREACKEAAYKPFPELEHLQR
jgi:hypothetical protein